MKKFEIGFRPLSGSYISQFRDLGQADLGGLKFPSPIGELHFSIILEYDSLNLLIVVVSVPYRGATFLNYAIYIWRR